VHKSFNRGDIFVTGGDTSVRGGDTQVTHRVTPRSPEYIKKATTAGAEPDGGSWASVETSNGSTQGSARSAVNPKEDADDTPRYMPPRCLHNPSISALKCEQCSKQYREGELE
jgi:hypothetical protein